MPKADEILEELRAIRDGIAESTDGDMRKIAEGEKGRQQTSGHQVVLLSPKRVSSGKKAS